MERLGTILAAALAISGCARSHTAMDAGIPPDASSEDADAEDTAVADAEPRPECERPDAEAARPCGPAEDPAARFVWNGSECQAVFWCGCAGSDCEELLFATEESCQDFYEDCD